MELKDINSKVIALKKKYGSVETNFYMGALKDYSISDFCENDGALIFGVQEANKHKFYYYYSDEGAFAELLNGLPTDAVIEVVSKEEPRVSKLMAEANINHYATYIRITTWWKENHFNIPEKGRRKILHDMYDPSMGELATMEDVEPIYLLIRNTFDPVCDDVFTRKEIESIINDSNCMICKEDGEIIALYIWRIIGKKLYSNMSINVGPANLLYNMERRVFSKCWDEGIRVSYAWFNVKNAKALGRGNHNLDEIIEKKEIMYNYIYKK